MGRSGASQVPKFSFVDKISVAVQLAHLRSASVEALVRPSSV